MGENYLPSLIFNSANLGNVGIFSTSNGSLYSYFTTTDVFSLYSGDNGSTWSGITTWWNEINSLAKILKELINRHNKLFDYRMPYVMVIYI